MPTIETANRPVPDRMERVTLLLALLVVLLTASISYRAWSAFGRNSDQLDITRRVTESTNGLLSSLTNVETGERGFLLTGRERYLDSYHQALSEIPGFLDSLNRATVTRPDQAKRLEALRPLIREKLDELQQTVELRTNQGAKAALEIVLTDRGKVLMDQIRQICTEIQSVAYGRLTQESQRARESANLIEALGTAGSVLLLALLIVSAITIQNGTKRRRELINNLQESEKQTRLARDWLRTTINSIGDAVAATDTDGKVILLNSVAESLTGWTLAVASGMPLEQVFVIVNEEIGQTVENPVARALREGRTVGRANHTNLISRDGRCIPIEDSAAPIRDANNQIAGVVLIFRDISERRDAERKEKEFGHKLAAIVESSDDAIISKDLKGIVKSWNRGAEKIFGYTGEEMIGRPISILAPPERAHEMSHILERIARGENVHHFETTRRTKDGRDIDISLTVSPVRDSQGIIVGASKIARNISERVAAESERRRQAELIARSNSDLQHFAYAASHDLREPLRTISVYSQILEQHLRPRIDAESSGHLKAILSAASRMAQLIDGLLEYSKASDFGRAYDQEIDTESAWNVAIANLQGAIEVNRAVITHDSLPLLPGNELHFVQLFQNLISNALKYRSGDAPRVHLSARHEGGEWLFSISDNGQGISPDYHEQIFELFKRLHGQDFAGSGIGLATCKKIVEQYGGRIWVESESGAGATFFFTVPANN